MRKAIQDQHLSDQGEWVHLDGFPHFVCKWRAKLAAGIAYFLGNVPRVNHSPGRGANLGLSVVLATLLADDGVVAEYEPTKLDGPGLGGLAHLLLPPRYVGRQDNLVLVLAALNALAPLLRALVVALALSLAVVVLLRLQCHLSLVTGDWGAERG